MAEKRLTKQDCITLLAERYARLQERGECRYPKRGDFTDAEVVAIKAFLGQWPRALEAAGIKEPREDDRRAKNREKRIRAKRRRLEEMRAEAARDQSPNADSNALYSSSQRDEISEKRSGS